jgi:hypothetical protein
MPMPVCLSPFRKEMVVSGSEDAQVMETAGEDGVHRQKVKFKKGAETIEQTDFRNVGFHPMIDMY